MARTFSSTHLACAALSAIAMLVVSCGSNGAPGPMPLQTPRPLTANATIDDGIRWLKAAGLTVERIGDDTDTARQFRSGDAQRVSVDGYDRVWIFQYDEVPDHFSLFQRFHLNASFPEQNFPQPLLLGNILFLVRGIETEAPEQIMTAIWDIEPPGMINQFQSPITGRWRYGSSQSRAYAIERLSEREGRDEFVAAETSSVLVTMRDLASVYGFTPLVDNMPHPDSRLWVSQFQDNDGGYVTVASEMTSGIPVAEIRTSRALDMTRIPSAPAPEIKTVGAFNGSHGQYDELHTVALIQKPQPVLHTHREWTEQVASIVIERRDPGEIEWKPIAWMDRGGIDLTKESRIGFVPPGGRVDIASENGSQVIRFWDYDVEQDKTYNYRFYACTDLGRTTGYSEVVAAIAGDPDPSTPDIAAHQPSVVPEIDCATERD